MFNVLLVCLIIISMIFGYKTLKRPVKIDFEYSFSCWIVPSLYMNTFVMIFFYLGLIVSTYIKHYENQIDNSIAVIAYNGFYILFACFIISIIMRVIVKVNYLDYSKKYSPNLIKILFSVAVLVNCVMCIILLMFTTEMNEFAYCVADNAVVWFATVVGSWIDVCFRCEGRIHDDLKYKNDSEERMGSSNKDRKYYGAFILSAILIVVIWAVSIFMAIKNLSPVLVVELGAAFCVPFLIIAIIYRIVRVPSYDNSRIRLFKRIKKYKKGKKGKLYYRNMRYTIENGVLIIDEIEVNYSKKNEMLKELFGKKLISVDINDKETINDILLERAKAQERFIVDCRDYEKEYRRKTIEDELIRVGE